MKDHDIAVNVEIEIDPYATPDEIILSGKLKQLKNKARIIIAEVGMDLHTATSLMIAIHRYNMKSNDFVFILPWLAHINDFYPWESPQVDRNEVRLAFEESIVITAHGYDKMFIEEFESKFTKITGIITRYSERYF